MSQWSGSPPHPAAPATEHADHAWFFRRAKGAAHAYGAVQTWTFASYRAALAASPLKTSSVSTLLVTALTANARGVTTVDRATVAAARGISVRTVSRHWGRAEECDLLVTKPRFDTSYVRFLGTAATRALPFEENADPLRRRPWALDELLWWEGLHETTPLTHPWGDERPPF